MILFLWLLWYLITFRDSSDKKISLPISHGQKAREVRSIKDNRLQHSDRMLEVNRVLLNGTFSK